MIRVNGEIMYKLYYVLDIHMTEGEWDEMSPGQQNQWIDENIGYEEMKSAEMDDCEVWDVIEISEEESA